MKNNHVTVRFRSLVSEGHQDGGEGVLIDLTREGCRVYSDVRVPTGSQLQLRLYLPNHDSSVEVELSAVRWSRGREFGLEFLRMRSEAQEVLCRAVEDLELGASH